MHNFLKNPNTNLFEKIPLFALTTTNYIRLLSVTVLCIIMHF